MPLTAKGEKIEGAMKQEYGPDKGESVFYASKNKGTISGVDGAGCPQHGYMDACKRGDSAGMNAHSTTMLRGRTVR
jgi:hypothetical protein